MIHIDQSDYQIIDNILIVSTYMVQDQKASNKNFLIWIYAF